MHHSEAERVIRLAREGSQTIKVDFVSPILSAILGAAVIQRSCSAEQIEFAPDAGSYAGSNGLLDAMLGRHFIAPPTGAQGKTYSRLTNLATANEVDACNEIINGLIRAQLSERAPRLVRRLTSVVGELHDNVASHANGCGFSCAQVYSYRNRMPEVEFAIADAGCGMLRNVNRIASCIVDDVAAIRWCLQDGNTTAGVCDDWAQWLPEDALSSPYSPSIPIRTSDNNHLGRGLGLLVSLVKEAGGELWIASGNGEYVLGPQSERLQPTAFDWHGVAIEFSIPVRDIIAAPQPAGTDLAALAKRLGI